MTIISPTGLRLATMPDGRKAIVIRTSDRIAFKSCRRKWSWSSHLKGNWGPKHLAQPLWFGSAIHFALEDFHGHKKFDKCSDAFRAYCVASSKQYSRDLPNEANEMLELGTAMMDYYEDYWLKQPGRQMHPTFWYTDPNGLKVPGTEMNFEIEVPLDENPKLAEYCKYHGADCILYRGTLDKVSIDEYGRLWVDEYKTAKRAEHMHYETDPQCTTYVWALSHIFPEYEVAGVTYVQFVKDKPKPPPILSSGTISTAKNLVTSSPLYRRALERMYGSVEKSPERNQKFLIDLYTKETENRDRYIVRTDVTRNAIQLQAEAQKILLELEDMLRPDLALYPAPTRDCSRMCSFLAPCVAIDAGQDFDEMILDKFSQRDDDIDRYWRKRMPTPEQLRNIRDTHQTIDIEDTQFRIQSMEDIAKRDAIAKGREEITFSFD